MKPTALIPYMRKSSGEDPAGSLERQRRAIAAWAELNGVELAPEVWEPGVSGSKPWRERGLGLAIEAVASGEAAGIICEDQSRLSRANGLQTAEVWDALQQANARLVCVNDGLDTASGDQELNFAIRAALAREQWKQYARRRKASVRRAVEAGIAVGRTNLGYRKRADKKMEVDPDAATIVLELFERRAAGTGWGTLADWLKEQTGHTWTIGGVRELIRNAIYKTGRLQHGEFISEHEAGAIVDEALWAAANKAQTRDLRPSRSDGFYLLSGLARCGECGHALNPNHAGDKKDGTPRHRYYCRNRKCASPRPQVEASQLERLVQLASYAYVRELSTRTDAPDLSALEDDVARTKRRLDYVTTPEFLDAAGNAAEVVAAARKYREEHEAALAVLGEARQRSPLGERTFNLEDLWDDLSPEDRRETLKLIWREVRVYRGNGRRSTRRQEVKLIARASGATTEVAVPTEEPL